jgi:hypothetical protein
MKREMHHVMGTRVCLFVLRTFVGFRFMTSVISTVTGSNLFPDRHRQSYWSLTFNIDPSRGQQDGGQDHHEEGVES